MDFAEAALDVAPADIVVLNRVVCCYHDMPKLVGAAADHTRQALVLSFPKERWWTQAALRAGDLMLRLARREFQVFLHSPDKIMATAELHGLETIFNRSGSFWQVISLGRAAPVV